MNYSLFYLCKPVYGGWVSFTAHLSLKHSLQIYKLGARTESRIREYGYGVMYRNIHPDEIANKGISVITAIDKHHYHLLKYFPDDSFIVIHDPTEVPKHASSILLGHLRRFKIITIRESVKTYLNETHGLLSTFIIHPFFPYAFSKSEYPKNAVSISRIDFDKHIDIILRANQKLSTPISIYGKANTRYVFLKLKELGYTTHYKGSFDKTHEALNNILKDAKYVIDLSVIRHDGGGTQYTFLEAIHQRCALVINKCWTTGFVTPFIHEKNCFIVSDEEDIATLLNKDLCTEHLLDSAAQILIPHINIDWIQALMTIGPKQRKVDG